MPVLAGLSALLVLGAAAIYSQTTKNSGANATGKLLTITYAPQDPNELASLIPHGQHIEQQLSATVKTPLHVVVGLHENQLDVVCLRADGSARTLHIAESQLAQLRATDLASCLP